MSHSEIALDRVFQALSDRSRRRIYAALRAVPGLTTGELAARFPGVSRWAVMKHLAVLRSVGLVQTLPEGRRRRHYIDPGPMAIAGTWLVENTERRG